MYIINKNACYQKDWTGAFHNIFFLMNDKKISIFC